MNASHIYTRCGWLWAEGLNAWSNIGYADKVDAKITQRLLKVEHCTSLHTLKHECD